MKNEYPIGRDRMHNIAMEALHKLRGFVEQEEMIQFFKDLDMSKKEIEFFGFDEEGREIVW